MKTNNNDDIVRQALKNKWNSLIDEPEPSGRSLTPYEIQLIRAAIDYTIWGWDVTLLPSELKVFRQFIIQFKDDCIKKWSNKNYKKFLKIK